VNFVATDAKKLVRLTRKDVNPGVEGGILIPKKPLNLLKTALPNDETPVIIDYNRSNVYFTFGETRLICRLLEDKYPDYAAVIPQENPNIITISRMALLSSINRISIFASKTTYQVRFKVTGNELTISAEDIEMANEAVEKIPCEFEGNDMEIARIEEAPSKSRSTSACKRGNDLSASRAHVDASARAKSSSSASKSCARVRMRFGSMRMSSLSFGNMSVSSSSSVINQGNQLSMPSKLAPSDNLSQCSRPQASVATKEAAKVFTSSEICNSRAGKIVATSIESVLR
jgi:hypothetical protein